MKRCIPLIFLALCGPMPTYAEGTLDRMIERFAEELLRELEPSLREMEPQMRSLAEDVLPKFQGLMDGIDGYEMPEIQPNGDIIIRRKTAPRADGIDI